VEYQQAKLLICFPSLQYLGTLLERSVKEANPAKRSVLMMGEMTSICLANAHLQASTVCIYPELRSWDSGMTPPRDPVKRGLVIGGHPLFISQPRQASLLFCHFTRPRFVSCRWNFQRDPVLSFTVNPNSKTTGNFHYTILSIRQQMLPRISRKVIITTADCWGFGHET